MRPSVLRVTIAATVALVSLGGRAAAEPSPREGAAALAAEGRAALAAGEVDRAVALWKQAYALHPAPAYLCNLGLALTDAGALARAHRFLTACLARGDLAAANAAAIAADRVRIEDALRAQGLVPVAIAVTPSGAEVALAGWPADELATSPTIVWLPPGPQTLTARAPGHQPGDVTLVVAPPGPVRAELTLSAITARPTVTLRRERPSLLPAAIVTGVGVVSLGVGVGFHRAALAEQTRLADELRAAGPARDEALARWRRDRIGLAIGYGAGAVAIGAAAYLWWRVHAASAPRIARDEPAALAWTF